MLTLLSPAALWALSALALPLALHLWRQPPRTVRLGSLRFLQAHTGRRLHDLRWRERLLLLSRLGLLAALACLLARPFWHPSPPRGPQRWILLDPTAALVGPTKERFNSLRANGYTSHLLTPGLPPVSGSDPVSMAAAPDLWSLLREADTTLPAGSDLAVFSPARWAALGGIRPALRSKVTWIDTPDTANSTSQIWVDAFRPATASMAMPPVIVGTSNAVTTSFSRIPPPGWNLETRTDAARLLGPNGETTRWTPAQIDLPLHVQVLHDADRTEDARYLAAAIHAATASGTAPLVLQTSTTSADLSTLRESDWTFWLSSNAIPEPLRARRTQWFQDAPSCSEIFSGWIIPLPGAPGAAVPASSVHFWRRGPVIDGPAVWTDEHGAPLLTCTTTAHGAVWKFASRFRPDWTDLPQTTIFPAWMRALLIGKVPQLKRDFRLVAAAQAQPSQATPSLPVPRLTFIDPPVKNLHLAIWIMAALLFVLERVLGYRRASVATSINPPLRTVAAVR